MPVMNDYEAAAVCDCVGFYSRADRSASYPDCNGTYEEQKTEKYAGRTDGRKIFLKRYQMTVKYTN